MRSLRRCWRGGRRASDVDDPRPDVWCFVARSYYGTPKLVLLEYVEQYKADGWMVIGPDPQQMAERMAWRSRNPHAALEDDGA